LKFDNVEEALIISGVLVMVLGIIITFGGIIAFGLFVVILGVVRSILPNEETKGLMESNHDI